jgi:hypothetical protein
MNAHAAVVILLGLAVLLLALDSWLRGPVMTILLIALVGLVMRNQDTISSEFGKVIHGG